MDFFYSIGNTWFRSQVMLIFVIFKAASKMSSALNVICFRGSPYNEHGLGILHVYNLVCVCVCVCWNHVKHSTSVFFIKNSFVNFSESYHSSLEGYNKVSTVFKFISCSQSVLWATSSEIRRRKGCYWPQKIPSFPWHFELGWTPLTDFSIKNSTVHLIVWGSTG